MFSWVTQQLETISQAVAPPPTDPPSLFVHCCSRGDEQGAMETAYKFASDPQFQHLPMSMVLVQPGKHLTALHVACQYGLLRVVEYLLTSSSGSDMSQILQVRDAAGNTPLHAAAAAGGATTEQQTAVLNLVKTLVTNYQASPVVRNAEQQTPYDVATLDRVRQYLLPIQLQRETQEALDNGGVGLPPGVDLGGLKINYANSSLAPPPTAMGGPPTTMPGAAAPFQSEQSSLAPASVFDTPTVAAHKTTVSTQGTAMEQLPQPPLSSSQQGSSPPLAMQQAAPTSNGSSIDPNSTTYATRGYSSAHIYNPKGKRVLLPDGFHSSSSDKRLQEKYGHAQAPNSGQALPPPPMSGNAPPASGNAPVSLGAATTDASVPALAAPASNPFAGGYSVFSGGARSGLQRYVTVDPLTGRPIAQQPSTQAYASVSAPASVPAPAMGVFTPGSNSATTGIQTTPANTTMFMPPPIAAQQTLEQPRSGGVPASAAGPSAATTHGLFPLPPKARESISTLGSQVVATLPTPPVANFPSPPRMSTSPGSTMTPSTTRASASQFSAPPTRSSPPAMASSETSMFPSPPISSSRLSSGGSVTVSSSTSASSLFASPPPPARSIPTPVVADTSAHDLFATPSATTVISSPREAKAPGDIFATPQPMDHKQQPVSAESLSAPPGASATNTVSTTIITMPNSATVEPPASVEQEPGRAGISDALPIAPKSNESVKSAVELFGSPPSSTPKDIPQAPKSGESVKSAAELFGAPASEVVLEQSKSDVVPSPHNHGSTETEVEPCDENPSPTEKGEPAAAEPGTLESESPSKSLDDDYELLQEVPLSPSAAQAASGD